MKLIKYCDFELNSINKINLDRVILVDECHYIGSFLSTSQIAPVSLDGIRYNLISGLDFNSALINAEINRVPTGVVDELVGIERPKSFRYKNIIVYENRDLEDTINFYIDEDLVLSIIEVDVSDRLIILTKDVINVTDNHSKSRYPHRIDKNVLVQSKIIEFSTLTPFDELEGEIPKYSGVPSAFCILPPHDKIIVGVYLSTVNCNHELGEYFYSWEPIYRVFDQSYLPVTSNKFI